jgi:hypothetical protein
MNNNYLLIYIPLFLYVIQTAILMLLYSKSNIDDKYIIPTISLTGMHSLNNDISYYIYLGSFVLLALLAFIFYIKCLSLSSKTHYFIILSIGICACILNIIQGIYSLDKDTIIHENTAYGGIFLHLLSLGIYLYYVRKHNKSVYILYGLAWLSLIMMPIASVTYIYKNKKYKGHFSLIAIFQRLCVLFIILTATFISKENKCFK